MSDFDDPVLAEMARVLREGRAAMPSLTDGECRAQIQRSLDGQTSHPKSNGAFGPVRETIVPNLHAERAAEKQASRDRDAADIREGRKTVEQVNAENSLAHGNMHRLKMRRGFGVK